MTRLEAENYIKDGIANLGRSVSDDLITDTIIYDCINQAMDKLVIDLNINPHIFSLSRITGEWEYALPSDVLHIRNLFFFDDDSGWQPITYEAPDRFLTWFDETDTDDEPEIFSVFGRMGEVYRFSTESAIPVNKFVHQFYVTQTETDILICQSAGFGMIESEEHVLRGDIVNNIRDDSWGFVNYLDMTTAKFSGTADAGTSSTLLIDAAVDFTSNALSGTGARVKPGDVILRTDSSNNSYAFVTAVAATQLTCTNIQGSNPFFGVGNTYKVGTSDRIVLRQFGTSSGGLREGSDHTFTATDSGLAAAAATFTSDENASDTMARQDLADWNTTTITTSMIALTNTGKSGKIRAVAADAIQVDYWVGGPPSNGDTVTFKTSDLFSIESKFATKDMLWMSPVPSETDVGIERLRLLYNVIPTKPDSDTNKLEIPDRNREEFFACLDWMVSRRAGIFSQAEIANYLVTYKVMLKDSKPVAERPSGQRRTIAQARYGRRGGSKWGARGITATWEH